MSENKVFNLDRVGSQWQEFLLRDARMKADKRYTDEFKKLLKEVSDNAQEFTFQGQEAATLRPGKLNLTLLAKEQPDLVKEYTRRVYKEEFDQNAFALELPEMFEKYRAQGLVLSTSGKSE